MSSVRNAFRFAVLITYDWMTVDSSDFADIQYLNSSSREVLRRPRWWQWRSFGQFKCSCTIMWWEWPGCIDDLFRVRNVSHGGHLLGMSTRFLLGSMYVLAALPHLQKVINLGHSVQFPFLRLFLHFHVVFCVHCIQFWVRACQNAVIGSSKLPYNHIFEKSLACGFWLPSADDISA